MDSTLSKGLLFAFCFFILAASILNARYLFYLIHGNARRRSPRAETAKGK